MLNRFLVNIHRAGSATAVKPVRLITIEEQQLVDRDSLKTWEQVVKATIERFNRLLPGTAHQDLRARLLKLEPMSQDGAVDRLGGPAAIVSALYLYLNTPNCTGGCIMLALQLEFASLIARLTTHMAIDDSEGPVQAEGTGCHQISNVLGYSIASAIAEQYCARSQYSPPVIIIDTARAIMELSRTEVSERQDSSQLLTGVIGVSASKSYLEGTFALCCPASLPEEFRADGNAELLSKQIAQSASAIRDPLSSGSKQTKWNRLAQ